MLSKERLHENNMIASSCGLGGTRRRSPGSRGASVDARNTQPKMSPWRRSVLSSCRTIVRHIPLAETWRASRPRIQHSMLDYWPPAVAKLPATTTHVPDYL